MHTVQLLSKNNGNKQVRKSNGTESQQLFDKFTSNDDMNMSLACK